MAVGGVRACIFCGSSSLQWQTRTVGTSDFEYQCLSCGRTMKVPLVFDSEKKRLKYSLEKKKEK